MACTGGGLEDLKWCVQAADWLCASSWEWWCQSHSPLHAAAYVQCLSVGLVECTSNASPPKDTPYWALACAGKSMVLNLQCLGYFSVQSLDGIAYGVYSSAACHVT